MYKDEKIKQVRHVRERERVAAQIFQISQEEFGVLNRTSRDERVDYAEY